MNKIRFAIAATMLTVSMSPDAFAADATKPVVPAPPIVASQPSAADKAAKARAQEMRERDMKVKAASGIGKKTAAVENSAARRVNKLKARNVKARGNTRARD